MRGQASYGKGRSKVRDKMTQNTLRDSRVARHESVRQYDGAILVYSLLTLITPQCGG